MIPKGFFGDMFDLNHDGEMDTFEKAAEFATFMGIMEEMEAEEQKKSSNGLSFNDDDELDCALEDSGLDMLDLEMMDDDERDEFFEDADLDPDDFDF